MPGTDDRVFCGDIGALERASTSDAQALADAQRRVAEVAAKVRAAEPEKRSDAEVAVIEAFCKLPEAARSRVLRYLASRFGENKP